MGLFNFLKKKEQKPTPAITASIHAQTVEVKQQTRGELPLAEIGGYVSPSGGFVNYGRFCVTGVNSTTGRKTRSGTRHRPKRMPELRPRLMASLSLWQCR